MGDIFLSYATANRTFVEKIRNDLEKKGKYSVWMDHCKIKGGHTWEIELDSNIRQCKVFVVTVTDASNESKWVRREFIRAEGLQKPIIPLLRDGDLPLRLLDIQYIDFQSDNQYDTGIQELLEVLKGYLPPSNNGNNVCKAHNSDSTGTDSYDNCSSSSEESVPKEPSIFSVMTRTVGCFYSSLWQTKKKNAKAHKVSMSSSKHNRRFMKKSNQYQSRNIVQRSTFQSITPTKITGTASRRTDETREAIKRLLFCVPHGWAEGKLSSAEQVESAKNFLCQARLQVSSTTPGNEKDGVNAFLENILNHLYVSGRPCLPKIIEKEPGIIVVRLKLANQDIGPLDFTPDGQMLKLLLEGIDNLYKSLHEGCDHKKVFVGGSWTGSVCILLRAQEKMITSLTGTLDVSSQGIDLGHGIIIIDVYSLFHASLRPPSQGQGKRGIDSDRSSKNIKLVDSHPYYRLVKSLDEVLTDTKTDRTQICFQIGDEVSDFTAYKNDNGDNFAFLIPASDQCLEEFLEYESQYWISMEQVLSGETANTPSLLDLFAGLQRASKKPERKEPRVDDNLLPASVVKNCLEGEEVETDLFPGLPNNEDTDVNKSDELISIPQMYRVGASAQEVADYDGSQNPKDVKQFDREDAPFDRPDSKITPIPAASPTDDNSEIITRPDGTKVRRVRKREPSGGPPDISKSFTAGESASKGLSKFLDKSQSTTSLGSPKKFSGSHSVPGDQLLEGEICVRPDGTKVRRVRKVKAPNDGGEGGGILKKSEVNKSKLAGDTPASKPGPQTEIFVRPDGTKVRRIRKTDAKPAAETTTEVGDEKKSMGDFLEKFLEKGGGSRPKVDGSASFVGDQVAVNKDSSLTGEVYVRADGKKGRRVKKSSATSNTVVDVPGSKKQQQNQNQEDNRFNAEVDATDATERTRNSISTPVRQTTPPNDAMHERLDYNIYGKGNGPIFDSAGHFVPPPPTGSPKIVADSLKPPVRGS